MGDNLFKGEMVQATLASHDLFAMQKGLYTRRNPDDTQ